MVTYSNSEDQNKTNGIQQQVEFMKTTSKPFSIDSPVIEKDVEEEEVLT